jgi:hypothetical protein
LDFGFARSGLCVNADPATLFACGELLGFRKIFAALDATLFEVTSLFFAIVYFFSVDGVKAPLDSEARIPLISVCPMRGKYLFIPASTLTITSRELAPGFCPGAS